MIEPRQDRSRATLQRILDATEELLNERAYEDISVAHIVERAASSVGSFYARFRGKDALFVALMERYHRDVATDLGVVLDDEIWHAKSLRQRAEHYVAKVVGLCRQRRGLLRLRLQRRIIPGKESLPDEPQRNRRMVGGLRELFQSCRAEIRHPDPDRALDFALRTVDCVVSTSFAMEDVMASYGSIDEDELVEQLSQTFVAYLESTP